LRKAKQRIPYKANLIHREKLNFSSTKVEFFKTISRILHLLIDSTLFKISANICSDRNLFLTLCSGKSYTTSSPRIPPGLDRSNGIGL